MPERLNNTIVYDDEAFARAIERYNTKLSRDIKKVFEEADFVIEEKLFFKKCQDGLAARIEQVGKKLFLNDIERYYDQVLDNTSREYVDPKWMEKMEAARVAKNRHYFEWLIDKDKERLEQAEISIADFLHSVNDDLRGGFKKLIEADQKVGELKIFRREKFPDWRDVEAAFLKKFPIVDIKLGYVISISKRSSHSEWRKLLYSWYNNVPKTEVFSKYKDDPFVESNQGYFRSSTNKNIWYTSTKLVHDNNELTELVGQKDRLRDFLYV